MVLIRLAFCTNPGLDIVNFRQACSVSYYLDAVAEHVGRVSGTPDDAEHHDSFYRFKQMGNRIKAWYERAVSLEQNGSPHLQAGSLRPSDLKEPSQLAEIGKAEQSVDFDMSSMDFLSLEGNDFWEQLQRSF